MIHKFKSSKEVVVMATPKVSSIMEQQIKKLGGLILHAPIMEPPDGVTLTAGSARWVDCFTKLHLWNMSDYSQLVYLDSDIFLLENIDDIFSRDSCIFSAVQDTLRPKGYFNAGLMKLKPNPKVYSHMLSLLENPKFSLNEMEQSFLNYYYEYIWCSMPSEYNSQHIQKSQSIVNMKTAHAKVRSLE
jgi:alpha-N-acetylglucosamine transferase